MKTIEAKFKNLDLKEYRNRSAKEADYGTLIDEDAIINLNGKKLIVYIANLNKKEHEQMKYPCMVTKKIGELSPAKYNPRKISDEALGRLTKSLAELGNLQPITWNARTGNLVGGHQRLKCYQAMGKTETHSPNWFARALWSCKGSKSVDKRPFFGEIDLP